MGNSNGAIPTDYQVESSDRITVYNCSFKRLDPDSEYKFSRFETKNGTKENIFYKFSIRFEFSVNMNSEILKGVFTRDPLFDSVFIDQPFPLKQSSDLKTGLLEEIGVYAPRGSTIYEHKFTIMVPQEISERRVCGFILDEDNVVLAKARGVVATEQEFHLSSEIEFRTPNERMSRTRHIFRMSKIEKHRQLKNVVAGMTDVLVAVSSLKKAKIEFIEASDGIKLAYRCYSPKENPKALLIIIAGNSHFHDIIASNCSKSGVLTYILEIRGYGYSGGERGYSPSKEHIWLDIKTFIKFLRINMARIPLLLGGHYDQAGLILNYSSWSGREKVDGYVFISPNFGPNAPDSINQEALARLKEGQPRPMSGGSRSAEFTSDSLHTNSSSKTSKLRRRFASSDSTLGSFTSALFGWGDWEHSYSEFEHEVNPMLVDLASSNVAKAVQAISPKRQFENIDGPFGLWVGENEELLVPEKLINYPKRANVPACITVVPGLTHMGMLMHVSEYIADWILTLDTVQLNHMAEGNMDVHYNAQFKSEDYVHPILADISLVLKSYVDLELYKVKSSYLLANDGNQVRYKIFSSSYKPLANVILLQTDVKVLLGYILSKKCNVSVFSMDIRGVDSSALCASKETILSDVKLMVRHLKFNNPEMPLLLGGHGYGASAAINYSQWKNREPVNGYLFISPVIDMSSTSLVDQSLVRSDNMRDLFSVESGRSWYTLGKKVQYSFDFWSAFKKKKTAHVHSVLSPIWEGVSIREVNRIFKSIERPFGLWVGDHDEMIHAKKLIKLVNTFSSNIPMKEVSLVPNATHIGNIITSSAYIAPFIANFCKVVAPSLSFKLRDPSLDDFEKIQFIGKGSFGKVYLVRHRISGKYFAMKVLSKADIVKANEVRHVIMERNILRQLNSSFVVSFVGSFQDKKHLYIIMEYVIGGELFTQMTLKKKFSPDTARFYAAEIVLFFEDIHSRKIIFRDLKPENILIDAMGHIKLTDFGFAKYLKKGKIRTFCGTPQYIAPEMIVNAEKGIHTGGYGLSVDYYALGILIYEMLMGQTPFFDRHVRSIYRKILYGNIEFPWGLDPVVKDLIKGLLNRKVEKRLGCGPGGIEEIKRHRWFKGVDWEQLRKKEIAAPFVPKFSHAGDTSNFITWAKDTPSLDEEFEDFGQLFHRF